MKVTLFAVYDKKAEAFNTPFVYHNDALAAREFTKAVMDENSNISHSPQDYDLYALGEYDDSTGKIESHSPEELMTGIQAKHKGLQIQRAMEKQFKEKASEE